MKKIHKWDFRIHLLFAIAVVIAIFGFQPDHWLTAEIVVGPFDVYKVNYQQKEKLQANKWTEYEISKALQSVTAMKVSNDRQLPVSYLLFKFEKPVTLNHSPIRFPVQQMIVTLPDRRGETPDLLLKNPSGQWIRYETTHPLTLLANDYR